MDYSFSKLLRKFVFAGLLIGAISPIGFGFISALLIVILGDANVLIFGILIACAAGSVLYFAVFHNMLDKFIENFFHDWHQDDDQSHLPPSLQESQLEIKHQQNVKQNRDEISYRANNRKLSYSLLVSGLGSGLLIPLLSGFISAELDISSESSWISFSAPLMAFLIFLLIVSLKTYFTLSETEHRTSTWAAPFSSSVIAIAIIFVVFWFIVLDDGMRRLLPWNDDQLMTFVAAENEIPVLSVLDEITHYFYARDALEGINLLPSEGNIILLPNLQRFVQLTLDEWGRPGNTLTYMLPSQISFSARRMVSVALLLLTTFEAMSIARIVYNAPDKDADGLKWVSRVVIYALVPVFLWMQPWYFYFGAQSLTQVPFMYFLTAAVAAWLNGRYGTATFFFSLLPITRHESLPLLFLWFIFLYRKDILIFVNSVFLEIFGPANGGADHQTVLSEFVDDLLTRLDESSDKAVESSEKVVDSPDKADASVEKKVDLREKHEKRYHYRNLRYVTLGLLPYLIWNFGSLAFRNGMPFESIFNDQSNAAYGTQSLNLFFITAQEWLGPVITSLFLVTLAYGGIAAFLIWYYRRHAPDAYWQILRNLILYERVWGRYFWWSFYLAFFLIHVFIITRQSNSLASGGYDFFILPIAPAVAVFCGLFLIWPFSDIRIPTTKGEHEKLSEAEKLAKVARDTESVKGLRRTLRIIWVFVCALGIIHVLYGAPLFLNRIILPNGMSNEDFSERRTIMQHTIAANQIFQEINEPKSSYSDTSQDVGLVPIITNNPVLRLTLEHKDPSYVERFCPHKLWNVDTQMPFYPNLFPANTQLILDGVAGGGLRSVTMMGRDRYDIGSNEFRLQNDDISTIFSLNPEEPGVVSPFVPWVLGSKVEQFNPTKNPNAVSFAENYGFQILSPAGEPVNNDEVDDFEKWISLYVRRYCGYAKPGELNDELPRQRIYAEVKGEAEHVYKNLNLDILTDGNELHDFLKLPEGSQVPVLDCFFAPNASVRQGETLTTYSPLDSQYCLVVFADTRHSYILSDTTEAEETEEEDIPPCEFNGKSLPNVYTNNPDNERIVSLGCFGWILTGDNVILTGGIPDTLAVSQPEPTPVSITSTPTRTTSGGVSEN